MVADIRGGFGRAIHKCCFYCFYCLRIVSSRLKKSNDYRDLGGPNRATQTYRLFWVCVGSAHLKSINGPRNPAEVLVMVILGFIEGLRISKNSNGRRDPRGLEHAIQIWGSFLDSY